MPGRFSDGSAFYDQLDYEEDTSDSLTECDWNTSRARCRLFYVMIIQWLFGFILLWFTFPSYVLLLCIIWLLFANGLLAAFVFKWPHSITLIYIYAYYNIILAVIYPLLALSLLFLTAYNSDWLPNHIRHSLALIAGIMFMTCPWHCWLWSINTQLLDDIAEMEMDDSLWSEYVTSPLSLSTQQTQSSRSTLPELVKSDETQISHSSFSVPEMAESDETQTSHSSFTVPEMAESDETQASRFSYPIPEETELNESQQIRLSFDLSLPEGEKSDETQTSNVSFSVAEYDVQLDDDMSLPFARPEKVRSDETQAANIYSIPRLIRSDESLANRWSQISGETAISDDDEYFGQ